MHPEIKKNFSMLQSRQSDHENICDVSELTTADTTNGTEVTFSHMIRLKRLPVELWGGGALQCGCDIQTVAPD